MVNRYNIVYPPRGRQALDGGYNSKFERSLIEDNQSPNCRNVLFSQGSVGTRPGITKLNTTAVGAYACDGLYTRRVDTGAETMVGFFGGSAWTMGTTTFTTIASAQSVFSTGVRVGTAQYQNYMFIGNGTVTPYKYNGLAFTRHGVPQATGTVTTISGTTAVGVLTGQYRWKVAFVNSGLVGGDVGTSTVTITLAAGQGYLTGIPVAPQSHGVNARQIYRTMNGGTTWLLAGTINDNTTTTYNDNVADTPLGAAAPSDAGEPPKYSIACYHQNRLFTNNGTNLNYLHWSELENPYRFLATSFQKIGDASSDTIVGIDVYQNNLFITCENSLYICYMQTTSPSDWRFIRIASSFGSRSPFANFLYQDKIMFAAMQNSLFAGFAAIAGMSVDPISTAMDVGAMGSELRSEAIEPDVFLMQRAYARNFSATVFKNRAFIAVTHGVNQTTNNRVYVFDFSLGRINKAQTELWAPYTAMNIAQFCVYGGKLYGGSSLSDGFVYEIEGTTYSDDSAAIDSYCWTKEFSGLPGHENLVKDFRSVRLLVDKAGVYNMNVGVRVDSDVSDFSQDYPVSLSPGGSIWGSFTWGVGLWGGGRSQDEIEVQLGAISGKRIQLKFSNQNTAGQRFKVHGLNYTYNIRGVA